MFYEIKIIIIKIREKKWVVGRENLTTTFSNYHIENTKNITAKMNHYIQKL